MELPSRYEYTITGKEGGGTYQTLAFDASVFGKRVAAHTILYLVQEYNRSSDCRVTHETTRILRYTIG